MDRRTDLLRSPCFRTSRQSARESIDVPRSTHPSHPSIIIWDEVCSLFITTLSSSMRSPRSREVAVRTAGAFDDDVLSTVSTNSSTVATTASLASRIAGLAIDLEDATAKEQELGTFPEEEEEELIEVTEEHVLRVLDAQEDPFQVGAICCDVTSLATCVLLDSSVHDCSATV